MLCQVFVLLAVSSAALAAVALQPLEEKPEEYKDCDGCWVSKIQTFIPIDEASPNPDYCGEYRCTEDYVEIVTCGVVAVNPPCKVIEEANKTAPYPDCCIPKIYCPPQE